MGAFAKLFIVLGSGSGYGNVLFTVTWTVKPGSPDRL